MSLVAAAASVDIWVASAAVALTVDGGAGMPASVAGANEAVLAPPSVADTAGIAAVVSPLGWSDAFRPQAASASNRSTARQARANLPAAAGWRSRPGGVGMSGVMSGCLVVGAMRQQFACHARRRRVVGTS
jgi:hypothetical protein